MKFSVNRTPFKTCFLLIVLIVVSSCKSVESSKEENEQMFTILHTNDIHGSYESINAIEGSATAQTGDSIDNYLVFPRAGKIGGIARLATAVSQIRNGKDKDAVLLLDGGDTFSDDLLSNITKGEVVIKALNQMGYDLMALGNHDFDYGLDRTRELEQMANFPMRAANVVEVATKKPIFNEPYKIFERQGIRIGVLPIAYRNTKLTGNPENMKGIRFEKGLGTIQKYLPELDQKSDIVVVLSHEGMAVDKLMADKVEGVDIIVGAHSHDYIEPPYKSSTGTYVVQAMSDAAVLGETELLIENKKLKDLKTNYHFLYADKWEEDAEIVKIIDDFRNDHLAGLEEPVAVVETPIGRMYKMESPFDKLVTTILKEEFGTDIAFVPGVGYGITLQEEVTKEDVFKLIPHNSKIVTLEMTGEKLIKLLEQTASNLKPEDKMESVGGLLQSSGISYTLDLGKPMNERICNVKIDGKNIDNHKIYKVATHSGMLKGIHKYTQFSEGTTIKETKKNMNNFITQKLKEMKKIGWPKNMGEVSIIYSE
ncbi:MAG TPA: multifunctional 2',3'-cyclic-nucleotide 2'-phosphodiesterase/5'-nucleotidase/3'-nucleotidase [Leeuwenhoekiella sp.]|nr:multifunctional 2',3'-cyclic-nucleotide 2'-phosphodiesterase/5'-nucleotidase/3'-nucleotidase [Leeuwenhoekiella sp.]